MKRSFSTRRSSSSADRGSVKRQKSYSTRDIPWKEQRALGGEFKSVGKGSWPVLKIIGERATGNNRAFLIEWRPHPGTEEEFEPSWISHLDVGDDLIDEWHRARKQAKVVRSRQEDKAAARRARLRRIIPESSADTFDHLSPDSDAPQTPPSLLSGSSASGPEILETQYPSEPLTVKLPPLPQDKADYETVQSSQPSLSTAHLEPSSPDTRISITSSQSQNRHIQKQVKTPVIRQSPRLASGLQSASLLNSVAPVHAQQPSRNRSSTQKSAPKAVQFVRSDQPGGASEQTPQSVEFITQLPFSDRSLGESTSSSKSSITSSTTRNSTRLASPFRDTASAPALPNPQSPKPAVVPASQLQSQKPHLNNKPPAAKANTVRRLQIPRKVSLSHSVLRSSPTEQTFEPLSIFNVSPSSNMASQRSELGLHDGLDGHAKSPLINSISQDDLPNEPPLFDDSNQEVVVVAADPSSNAIHESIEEEPQSSTETSHIMDSKINSSQESLNNEREIETVDGIMIPARPIFGPNEYAIALPAEGKVKSAYDEIIKLKKKSIMRFVGRKGSPGTSEISSKKTSERNEMQEMLQRLNDTTTHTDLGLSATQYSLSSQENAAYADYAGSKFTMLGYLLDHMKIKTWSFAIFAQEGSLQSLLEEYINMKRVTVRRHDRRGQDEKVERVGGLSVDLLTTQSDKPLSLSAKPAFIVAFDASFTTSDSQVRSIQEQYGPDIPIIHFLVTNSSEHVERCVPVSLTSNIRLKIVVRTTYLAWPNLGGEITYVPDPSDQPSDDRPMDMLDIQRAVRKSPARRMDYIADIVASLALSDAFNENWTLGGMPELKLAPMDSPAKPGRGASRTPQPRNTRTHTPASRATTPVGRKRLLDVEAENGHKRQRLTPVRDVVPESQRTSAAVDELNEARKHITQLTAELTNVRNSLRDSEKKQTDAEAKRDEWQESHADLLRRHEASRKKQKELHKENQKLNATAALMKTKDEVSQTEKVSLRQQVTELKAELSQARDDLKSAGGDIADLELARDEARIATTKFLALERSLKSTKEDFEFTRSQYQDASKQATDLALEVKELESQVERLKLAAEDSKRSLKAMNYEQSLNTMISRAEQFKLEVKNRESFIRKLLEENASLKTRRGVNTRGNSAAPSPGPRSRQASPAPGHLMPPSGTRASVLRNER